LVLEAILLYSYAQYESFLFYFLRTADSLGYGEPQAETNLPRARAKPITQTVFALSLFILLPTRTDIIEAGDDRVIM